MCTEYRKGPERHQDARSRKEESNEPKADWVYFPFSFSGIDAQESWATVLPEFTLR